MIMVHAFFINIRPSVAMIVPVSRCLIGCTNILQHIVSKYMYNLLYGDRVWFRQILGVDMLSNGYINCLFIKKLKF
jgi:hypothetical protein